MASTPPRSSPITATSRVGTARTCLVADDHPAIVSAVCDYLASQGLLVTARARNGDEALAQLEQHQPDVALIDIRMPGLSGIELTRRAARVSPGTAVVLYTALGDRAQLTDALDAGARGFLLKEAPLDDLVRAIEIVAGGGTYIDPVLAGAIAVADDTAKIVSLTQRERDVLRLLADGLSNEGIGKRLFISPETVRTHVRKAMERLDADTRTQAVAEALRRSLIS